MATGCSRPLLVPRHSWLKDHVIYGTLVVPGATYAAMGLHAVSVPADLHEVVFHEPLLLTGGESATVTIPPEGGG